MAGRKDRVARNIFTNLAAILIQLGTSHLAKKEACAALWSHRLFLVTKRDRSNGPLRNDYVGQGFRLRGSPVSGNDRYFCRRAMAVRDVFDQ
jgi:hypothetical protein